MRLRYSQTTKKAATPTGREKKNGALYAITVKKPVQQQLSEKETFEVIFEGNRKAIRRNLDRFAPRI